MPAILQSRDFAKKINISNQTALFNLISDANQYRGADIQLKKIDNRKYELTPDNCAKLRRVCGSDNFRAEETLKGILHNLCYNDSVIDITVN